MDPAPNRLSHGGGLARFKTIIDGGFWPQAVSWDPLYLSHWVQALHSPWATLSAIPPFDLSKRLPWAFLPHSNTIL